ncbi:uncharacterized protein M421DRAFT_224646 [Didymella exigua CBS 183.55]|uniref:Uncharacterized protein n=1 Tax=Didymella exigua CBS 183.55 TaxID=1150837 RepID=A0A6A5RCW3_9PLEO|nr:uncharacterized protein M421DRAFT_224646 [Didymella exigua CBS 183.55]KAF1926085.1 hypothetical protein M421DRAFT_224646 [Didymella exigua CBS 183.55]
MEWRTAFIKITAAVRLLIAHWAVPHSSFLLLETFFGLIFRMAWRCGIRCDVDMEEEQTLHERSMNDGWMMDDGRWMMDDGRWTMDDGWTGMARARVSMAW